MEHQIVLEMGSEGVPVSNEYCGCFEISRRPVQELNERIFGPVYAPGPYEIKLLQANKEIFNFHDQYRVRVMQDDGLLFGANFVVESKTMDLFLDVELREIG